MLKEANHNNLHYGTYDRFINFRQLIDLVLMEDEEK